MSETALGDFLATLIDRNSCRLAFAGTVEGVLAVPDRPGNSVNFIYCRWDDLSPPFECRISAIRPALDDVIWVMNENPNEDSGWRLAQWVRAFADPDAPVPFG